MITSLPWYGSSYEKSFCMQMMSMVDCKAMHRQEVDDYVREVVGFYLSLTCVEAGCARVWK